LGGERKRRGGPDKGGREEREGGGNVAIEGGLKWRVTASALVKLRSLLQDVLEGN